MSNALLAGVSGLQAHQTMLDVAGNNLANVDTYGFKSSRVSFAELLSETIREATQPTATQGGTNPQQIGAGVSVSSIDRNMAQGNLVFTGQPLDMAIEGPGYFSLNDGQKEVYTRVGAFAVDADFHLVDPATGFRVQRTGTEGEALGFQNRSSSDIRIPYDVALPAKATETVTFGGNLSADSQNPTAALLTSGLTFTEAGGTVATRNTLLTGLEQAQSLTPGETIAITGTDAAGAAVNATYTIQNGSTVGDLVDAITAAFSGSTASISNGEIRLADNVAGYSQTDLYLAYNGAGQLQLPKYFKMLQVGAEEARNTNVEVFDAQGASHILSVAFARTKQPNVWDIVLAGTTGEASMDTAGRRVKDVTFGRDGSFAGLGGATPDISAFQVAFGAGAGSPQTIDLALGTVGGFDGLSQFGGASTASASLQDGYEAGYLSSMAVGREGIIVGTFTNGIRQDIAAIKLTTFLNPAALESVGNGYYAASANSGDPVPTRALAGGAGSVAGGSLEKSNVDMASEFVNLIQAQNGYQANARTIRVATDMLRELTNLIR
jgi:flagellar hook protein FlgE